MNFWLPINKIRPAPQGWGVCLYCAGAGGVFRVTAPLDRAVNLPQCVTAASHLKLSLLGHVGTPFGLIIQRPA
jgi:hypothetical protein